MLKIKKLYPAKIGLIAVFMLAGVFIFTGCNFDLNNTRSKIVNQAVENFVNNSINYSQWHKITEGMEIREYKIDQSPEVLTVIKIQPDKFEFKIIQDENNPKSVFDWQKSLGALLVINGAFFDENNLPTGFLQTSVGKRYNNPAYMGENNYTGAFIVDDAGLPEVRYLPTQNYGLTELKFIQATFQTFPTLITPGGKKADFSEPNKTARRTVLGQDKSGNFYIIISQDGTFTLSGIRDWLISSDLNLDVAINLDGGTSTGLEINKNDFNYSVSSFQVPNVIAIYEK